MLRYSGNSALLEYFEWSAAKYARLAYREGPIRHDQSARAWNFLRSPRKVRDHREWKWMPFKLNAAIVWVQKVLRLPLMSSNQSKPALKLSQNWATLKSALPKASKKRKREGESVTLARPAKKEVPIQRPFTEYNPWHPNDSVIHTKGNAALTISPKSKDNITEFTPQAHNPKFPVPLLILGPDFTLL